MDVQIIRMDPDLAQAKLIAYQQQLKRRADIEYEQAVAGYQALAAGTPLISLFAAFEQAGLGEDKRPRLAVARADRQQVKVTIGYTHFTFDTQQRPRWSYDGSLRIYIPFESKVSYITGYALVPMVPADVRPKGNLRDYFILWEVEQWANYPLRTMPDRDPLLLRHLAGDLYAVVAQWELTDLERAITATRRN